MIIPTQDYDLSKSFYQDLGFDLLSCDGQAANFEYKGVFFELREKCQFDGEYFIECCVENLRDWHRSWIRTGVFNKYNADISTINQQEFFLQDPSGITLCITESV